MKRIVYSFVKITRFIPEWVRPFLTRILHIFFSKEQAELLFQKGWAREFSENKEEVLEYWKRYRYFDEIEKRVSITDKKNVLDVGCGISTVLHFINGDRYGIDPLATEYKKLYNYPSDIVIKKASGESIPFEDNYFDVCFCSNVLDHVSDPQKVLKEISRVLKKKGYFVLTVETFSKETKRDLAHPHSLANAKVKKLVAKNFSIIFEKKSKFIGLRHFVNGSRKPLNDELIVIATKK